MNCISEGNLRAYRDRELDSSQLLQVQNHLEECTACRGRSAELESLAGRVSQHLSATAVRPETPSVNAQSALARFNAEHGDHAETSELWRLFTKRWRPVWVAAFVAVLLVVFLVFPLARSWAQRFLLTLRVEKVQPVSIDTSSLEGNPALQQAIRQMISDRVVVTVDEKEQPAASAEAASELAGFRVRVVGGRADSPAFTVLGRHSFNMTAERARLQDIFNQAGRPDLVVPESVDGAMIAVQIPRGVLVRYGNCERPRKDGQNTQDQSQPARIQNCLVLFEIPSPLVSVPSNLDVGQLAEVALQVAGLSPGQAKEFSQTVDWKSTLVLPLPRHVRSYNMVDVSGVQGTLVSHFAGPGPNYTLVWVKNGVVYSLVGFSDAGDPVALANSVS